MAKANNAAHPMKASPFNKGRGKNRYNENQIAPLPNKIKNKKSQT
jgi:hypothetical protein